MLLVIDNSCWHRLNHLIDTRLAEQLSRTLQALDNTWRPFMQAMGVRSNTMNQLFLEQAFSSAASRISLHTYEATCHHLGQYPLLKQSSESMEVLLNCTIPLRMSNNWNNSKCPQFKNQPLSFREPGATPQLQEEITTTVECRQPSSLDIFDQSRLDEHFVATKETQRNIVAI